MRLDWILDVSVPSELISLMQVAADQTAIGEGLSKPVCTTVRFCDDAAIRELNAAHRGLDQSTDVLSFPMGEYDTPADFSCIDESPDYFNVETGELMLGDIVLSYDRIRSQAEEYGHSERREYAFLIVHSMLHLIGYDHIEEADRELMEERQRVIMDALGISR